MGGKAGQIPAFFAFCTLEEAKLMTSRNKPSKLGKTQRMNAESKAEVTRRISSEIAQTEAEQRRLKTEKLKAARLALEENLPLAYTGNTRKKRAGSSPKVKY